MLHSGQYTVRHKIPELHFLVLLIQFFEKCPLHILFQFIKRIRKPLPHTFLCCLMQGFGKPAISFVQSIRSLQIICRNGTVILWQHPQSRVFPQIPHLISIRNIKYIQKAVFRAGCIINQGNSFRAFLDPSVHPLIPYLHGCHSSCFRSLGKDQELFIKGVFI